MDKLQTSSTPTRLKQLLHKLKARLRRPSSPADAARARARRQKAFLAKGAAALPYLQLLLAAAGCLQFLAIPLPLKQLLKKSYIDENAFQPGQVNTYFSWSDVSAADRYAEGLEAFVHAGNNVALSDYIVHALEEQGLPAMVQDYPTLLHKNSTTGRNTYARLRSPKTSGSEVVVLCAPWISREAGMKNVRGTATLLALAKHLQRLSMWSKDIIILFSDVDFAGVQAWLYAYHGVSGHGLDPLPVGGASIWSAITLDYPYHSFSHIGLYYDGVNGRLPNLDVVHGAAHIAKWVGGVPVRLYNQTSIEPSEEHTFASFLCRYRQRAATVLQQTLQSASTVPKGAEGLFSQYGIDSIAFFAVPAEGPYGFYSIGRIIESMTRAFNNLTERLHASFFLYLLPEPFHFLPVATYLSAPILIGAALTIAGLRLWQRSKMRVGLSVCFKILLAYTTGGIMLLVDETSVVRLSYRHAPFRILMSCWQLDSTIASGFLVALMSCILVSGGASGATPLALECLVCGMLISVLSILNYGLGSCMAILAGLPSLAAVYSPTGQRQQHIRRGILGVALFVCAFVTFQQYSTLRPALEGVPGMAPVIIHLGLLPLWLQLAFVA